VSGVYVKSLPSISFLSDDTKQPLETPIQTLGSLICVTAWCFKMAVEKMTIQMAMIQNTYSTYLHQRFSYFVVVIST